MVGAGVRSVVVPGHLGLPGRQTLGVDHAEIVPLSKLLSGPGDWKDDLQGEVADVCGGRGSKVRLAHSRES